MPEESPLLSSLRAAVAAAPDDIALRVHYAELLLDAGRTDEAVAEAALAVSRAPADPAARALLARAIGNPAPAASREPEMSDSAEPEPGTTATDFDWDAAEEQVRDVIPPRYEGEGGLIAVPSSDAGADGLWQVDDPDGLRLADVGGMQDVKDRLEAAFLAPMRNPELRRLYGKSLRGGMLLYGPPGCGKTFLARAVAGELGAGFLSVTISDILDQWLGNSEKNLHEIFATARAQAPCVIMFDELDAIGGKRSRHQSTTMRTVINQLLIELDGVDSATANEGVFVLAATNTPWDVDLALRRPGRLDRMVLVTPPDAPARAAIIDYHLRERPIERVDIGALVRRTEGYSGADIAHVCESASEMALLDSVRTGTPRMITTADLLAAAGQIRSSCEEWFAAAENVATFSNESGAYDDLVQYLRNRRRK
ncbi:AAA ATPase central domain protein OS=Tsukamurella paurometabola (strain ATCC 8368 / DSM / CCUG 35730 / CIP 100753 / JCM 10117 / KCTC 9821 / NBRC 16120 /NCIMB 702349 / NCTC 13040) OX=521096 GN=Tpau_1752 PE=3 SV=1 [Tsukamurella paurometabola]|uniref:AAA ATPase central domain protein n=1 Tax=Tsukamurella paurometabola (strain ATCC 8368 / DSM 20162 / CCUG 35730 / CIP 100753 / JCM 10117 / KCTC 9821 / NBRC 16120 / NCIMB 702349 / NCTC 13040) TaxID=521096 RepID=D5UM90_TSUPD|nr:ATP-binding protein [Tsukamurella paurometabola]ADG78370.1 AAA ATPase central domain protein [Tsukamurella paurometabola DSM 20162]SUP31382.1 ATP-dependent zinc metalloprotease FtsH 2 [Tsukamurella paurometabola]